MIKKLLTIVASGVLLLGLTCTIGQAKVIITKDYDFQGHDIEDVGTLGVTTFSASTVDIDGGTIDETAIGGTTASTGAFTDLSSSGAFSLTGDDVQDDEVVNDLTIDSTKDINTTGVYKTSGTQISSDDLSDTDSIAMLDEAETITGDWVNTAHPWVDNEVANDIEIDNTTSVTTDGAVTAGGTSKITFTPAGGEIATTGNGDILLNPAGTGIVTTSAVIHGTSSLWWYVKYVDAFSITPGTSGATLIPPDANTLGGYQLDNAGEELYFNAHIFDNWDASSDLELVVVFEVNVDHSGGADTDTVDIKVVSYYKGEGETANKTQTVEVATIVGKSPQYKQFTATLTIDYDAVDNVVEVDDTVSFIVNLETDTSEVDDIIVNATTFRYRSIAVNPEI